MGERPRAELGGEAVDQRAQRLGGAACQLWTDDVVDRLADGRDLLRILVGDLEAELVLELHDQLDEVERVRIQVGLERRVLSHLLLVDAELLHQDASNALECLLTIHR